MQKHSSGKSIFIGIPSRGMTFSSLGSKLAMRLTAYSNDPDHDVTVRIVRGFPVDVVRNNICEMFMESGSEYLLMIDDDVVPPANLLDMARHEKDVIGGLYYAFTPIKGIFSVAYRILEDGSSECFDIGSRIEHQGLKAADLVGGGCMMIRRRVLDAVEKPFFKIVTDEAATRLVDTEDFYFCRKAAKAGFSIYLDTDMPCGHVKQMDLRALLHWCEQYARRSLLMPL
jgi:GT2 family glycosyltransferase